MARLDAVYFTDEYFIGFGHRGGDRGGRNYNRGGGEGGGRYEERRGDHPGSHANFGRRDRRDSDRRPPTDAEFREPTAGRISNLAAIFDS